MPQPISRYAQFPFQIVDEGGQGFRAGFQDVSGLQDPATPARSPIKIPSLHKLGDITLKRGVNGDSSSLSDWLNQVKQGIPAGRRILKVEMVSGGRVIKRWRLEAARPKKYTGPALAAKGNDVAIEELVLSCERIDPA